MKLVHRFARALFAGSTLAALVVGGLALTSSPALAVPPEPDCGPTFTWICTGPGGPVEFEGTVCEKNAFQKQTGLRCVRG